MVKKCKAKHETAWNTLVKSFETSSNFIYMNGLLSLKILSRPAFLSGLWIGLAKKRLYYEANVQLPQVGARFEALNQGVLVTLSIVFPAFFYHTEIGNGTMCLFQ